MVQLKRTETKEELQGILTLQSENIKSILSEEIKGKEGFVTLKHEFDLLEKMNLLEPHIIAKENDRVVGYALVMVPQLKDEIPILFPMFEKINTLTYNGHNLSESSYYVMGQVCIAKDFRGKGLFQKLYEMHMSELSDHYDYCITEVSKSNPRSIRAHEKVGFQTIHSFTDKEDSWEIILLDLKKTNV